MWWANYLVGFGKPNFTWANFVPQKLTPLKITIICDLWYSFDRVQSPDHFGMLIFEIVNNLLTYGQNTYAHIWA